MLHDVSYFTLLSLLPSISYWGTFIHLKYQYLNLIIVVAFFKINRPAYILYYWVVDRSMKWKCI